MATTPPIYSFPGLYYNPVFFPSISGFLTLSQANTLYLARSGVASSVAILTSFTGAVTINGLLTLTAGLSLTGGLTVDTLTVNTLSTLNTNTIINNILTINATNSIVGQTTFTLAPILPAGYQFLTTGTQTITGLKIFSSVITSNGINDSLSITSPTITGSTIVNGGTFNATNIAGTSNFYSTSIIGTLTATVSTSSGYFTATSGAGTSTFYGTNVNGQLSANSLNTNLITNSSASLPITISTLVTSSIPTVIDTIRALRIGWNGFAVGQGETDFINCAQGGDGGFSFSVTNAIFASKQIATLYTGGGLRIFPACGQLQVDDQLAGAYSLNLLQSGTLSFISSRGINTTLFIQCGDGTGAATNVFQASTTAINTLVNFSPTSTTTFNAFHPTTSLGNNLSTNTTQYATVGYVNGATPTSLLGLNNTFTGLNTYTQRIQMTIKTDTSTTCIGTNAGASLGTLTLGSSNTYYGYNAGVYSVNPNSETIVGAGSGPTISGSFNGNTVLGTQSVFNGAYNTIIGTSAGNLSTTTVYNSSTCIGSNSRITASNQITLGTVAETVLMPNTLTVQGLANILGFSVLPNLPTTYIAPTTTQIGYNFSQTVILTSPSGWVNYPANQLNTMPFGTYQVNACLNLLTSTFSTITQYTLTIGTGLAVVNRNCAAQMGYYTANLSGSGATPDCITCACSTVYTGFGSNLNISVWTGTLQANCQLTWNVIRIA